MSESTSYDNLIAGTQKNLVTEPGTVRVYESFSRGALLGRLTATGKWQVCDEDAAANFNQFGIASEAIDTTAGTEALTDIYVEGEFSENGVIFAYSDTADDWRVTLEAHNIYLRKTISVLGQ
jgi:hypothetical protein